MVVVVQPIVDAVRQSYAKVVRGSLLVEYQAVPATGTPEVATVVYGQSDVFDPRLTLLIELSAPEVRALVVVAITIGAVQYG